MTETLCEKCGRQLGTGHDRLETDCVLEHADHQDRDGGLICRKHFGWIDRTLTAILDLYALLPDVIVPGPASGDRRSASVHSPAPGRVDVMALSDRRTNGIHYVDDFDAESVPSIPDALASWVFLVFEERGIEPPDWTPALGDWWQAATARRRPVGPACAQCRHATCVYIRSGQQLVRRTVAAEVSHGDWVFRAGRWQIRDDVASLVRVLRRERIWISRQLWVDDFAADLALLHRQVATGAGDSMWPKPIGKCPNCQCALYPTVGIDVVRCRRCKNSWEGLALARLRLIHEQEAG
ncbi:hypothetical protein [Jatrophihabitans sp.]|uniref:hypothetical protein n=1 Tax=Jatrophihabitans sp. TaxID=1932789 RepID=UPI0030C7771D|nr:hypothetical protein [Jatrophihabitans sp.]